MKIAFITGMNYLDIIQRGDIAFALAHQVLSNETYARWFKDNKTQYKIIDNGAAELGKSIGPKELMFAAKKIGTDEIWCPDKLFEKDETKKLTIKFFETISKEDLRRYKFVGIPQGRNLREWLSSYKEFESMSNISVIAISKYSVECFKEICNSDDFSICREVCIKYLHDKKLFSKPLHLAGANQRWIDEIKFMQKYNKVRSTDSNICFKLGVFGKEIDKCNIEPSERLNHDIKDLTKKQIDLINYNIERVKEVL